MAPVRAKDRGPYRSRNRTPASLLGSRTEGALSERPQDPPATVLDPGQPSWGAGPTRALSAPAATRLPCWKAPAPEECLNARASLLGAELPVKKMLSRCSVE